MRRRIPVGPSWWVRGRAIRVSLRELQAVTWAIMQQLQQHQYLPN